MMANRIYDGVGMAAPLPPVLALQERQKEAVGVKKEKLDLVQVKKELNRVAAPSSS